MNTLPKSLQSLAFRFLRERNRGVILLCAFGAVFPPRFASANPLPTTIESCESGMKSHFKVIHNLNNETINPLKIDKNFVSKHCQKNIFSLKNQRAGDSETQKIDSDGRATDPMNGACQLSYWEIRSTFEALKKEYRSYCEKVIDIQKIASQCRKKDSTDPVESCLSDLDEQQKLAEKKFEEIKTKLLDKFPEALQPRKDKNEEIKAIFEADRGKLKNLLASSIGSDYPGSEGFLDFNEYKAYVEENPARPRLKYAKKNSEGPLIDEQELAQKNIDEYLKSVDDFKNKGLDISSKMSSYMADIKKRTQDNKSANSLIGTGAQAAPGLTSLAAQNQTTAAAAVPAAGISGSAASAVLPLATLGAAAASRSASGSSSASSPAATAAAPAPVTPIVPTSFGVDRAPASAAGHLNEALKASEEKITEASLTAAVTPLSGEGSSRMGQLKRGNKSEEPDSGNRQAENYANNGSEPGIVPSGGPRSTSRTSSPPADVTNLLGQMKSLFNFDEPSGTGSDAAFGGAMPGLAVGGLSVNGPAAEASGDYAANGEAPAAINDEGSGNESVQSESLAIDADSLFVRVHKRHVRCEQRGLIVINLGGIR